MFNLAFEGLDCDAWQREASDCDDLVWDDSDFNMSRFKLLRFPGQPKGCPAPLPWSLPYYHYAAPAYVLGHVRTAAASASSGQALGCPVERSSTVLLLPGRWKEASRLRPEDSGAAVPTCPSPC
jgi:hypothetical protein